MNPKFFATPAAFRKWLAAHHTDHTELWVGFYKVASTKKSITWPEAVDQALCFGWIDGVRRSVDDESYTNRFTPRRVGSTWSAINTNRMVELIERGLVQPPGLAAFEGRDPEKTNLYSYERDTAALSSDSERTFRKNNAAWTFFTAQPPSYRKVVTHWVVSAKRDETRQKRLTTLIEASAAGRRL
jgi:uncharacterized protein YdeI (YjbR/CyaY-like superfamily)